MARIKRICGTNLPANNIPLNDSVANKVSDQNPAMAEGHKVLRRFGDQTTLQYGITRFGGPGLHGTETQGFKNCRLTTVN